MARGVLIRAALALALLGAPAAAEPPARVVSMNLCTDQLAMLLAAPGQLVSVSFLAADPRVSAMAEDAAGFPANHGQAEQIFLLRPDLVLAGAYTGQATVALLERLGIPVVRFDPESGMADIRANILAMGAALGREAQAAALAAEFDADLAALAAEVADQPLAALYYANGYTSGDRTLAGEILAAAGFANAAAAAGLDGGGFLPLEMLIMAHPDLVVTGGRYPAASRSEELLDHPALRRLAGGPSPLLADRDWVCGTPFVLRAVRALRDHRLRMAG